MISTRKAEPPYVLVARRRVWHHLDLWPVSWNSLQADYAFATRQVRDYAVNGW